MRIFASLNKLVCKAASTGTPEKAGTVSVSLAPAAAHVRAQRVRATQHHNLPRRCTRAPRKVGRICCRSALQEPEIELITGRAAHDYLTLQAVLGSNGIGVERAVPVTMNPRTHALDLIEGFEDYQVGVPGPMPGLQMPANIPDPYRLQHSTCGAHSDELILARMPLPMAWVFAVFATSEDQVYGLFAKGEEETSSWMFWNGDPFEEILSLDGDRFGKDTVQAMFESCTRKQHFFAIGIEAHAVQRVLIGWEETIPAEARDGVPALRLTGYITDKDEVIFREIAPAWVSPPAIGSSTFAL